MSITPGHFSADHELALPALRLTRSSMTVRGVAGTLVIASLLLLVGLIFMPWQQNVPGHGRVIGFAPLDRQQAVEAPVDGRIVHWFVHEGSRVKAGDTLVEIADNDPRFLDRLRFEQGLVESRQRAAEDRVRAIEERIQSLTASREMALTAARARVSMAKDRLRAAEQSLEAAKAARRTAELQADRVLQLAEEGIRSQRDRELVELDLIKAQTDEERAGATMQAAKSDLASMQADLEKVANDTQASIKDSTASLQSARAEVAKVQGELNQANVKVRRQEQQVVVAPRDGTILRLVVNQDGEMVKAGDDLAILVPDTEQRAVELWVDGNDIPLVEPGRHVRLQFEGWPAVQFVGWPSVAVGTFGGSVALIDSADDGSGKFRIVVRPDPADDPWPSTRFLRQGSRANGWVMLNQVTLGYELWRQFNGFPPVTSIAEPGSSPPKKKDK